MRHIDTVEAIARSANARGYHFGAIIFQKKTIISAGWCQEKSHPLQAKYNRSKNSYKSKNSWLHAEVHAIINAKNEAEGADMIIGRYADGRMKPSCPCSACMLAIEYSGIRNIWFLDHNGNWIREKVQ